MWCSRILRNIRLGVKDLSLHRMRSLLTMLGVVFGVGSVIAMLAVGEGASRQALEQIRRLGSNNIIITSIKPTSADQTAGDRSRMSVYGLYYEDEHRVRDFSHVTGTVPARAIRKNAYIGERRMELRVVGTIPEWFQLVRRDLVAGRAIMQHDVDEASAVCVLTEHGARKMLAGSHTIGEKLRIGSDHFEVVGIIRNDEGSTAIQSPDREIDAYIPLNVSLARFGEIVYRRTSGSRIMERVELHTLLVEMDEPENVEPTAAAIESMLRHFHRNEDYRISVPLTLLRQAETTKRTFNIVLGSIAGISLLVGGIGIMNIMLASVTERTREIGIRRAIGAKRRQIIVQFLVETVVLSCAGGIIGTFVGVMTPRVITRLSGVPTVVPLYSIVLSLGISLTIGIIFGMYPAARAANLDPIEALRHE